MRSFFAGCVTLLASSLLGGALPIILTVDPISVLSGGRLSLNTSVSFTCSAYDVRVLRWLRNGNQIENFTGLDVPSTEPQLSGAFRVFLNSSDNDGQNNLNATSTLIGLVSDFQTGDQIACLDIDATGETLVLNFTITCRSDELGASEVEMNSQCLPLPNGMVCYNDTIAGSVATYSCDNGFMLTGSAERMCRIDGRWEGSVPSCEIIVPSWVLPLLVVSVILWVICLVEGIISIPISIVLERKVSKNENRFLTAFSYGLLVVEIILFLLIFILWMVYASDPNGVHGRNCVIAAFVFTLVLLGLSFTDVIPVFLYLKSTVYAEQESQKGPHHEEEKEEQRSENSKDDRDRQ